MLVEIFFDGACEFAGKPGKTGVGVAVYIDKLYSIEFSTNHLGDNGFNNVAEWCALIRALKIAKEVASLCKKIESEVKIIIYSDSQLVVNQFNGYWEIKHCGFVKYFTEAKKLSNEFEYTRRIKWIPRTQNKQADKLSKVALGKPTVKKDYSILE